MKQTIATVLIVLAAVTALTVPLPSRTEAGIEQERKRQIDIELVKENEGYEFSPGETVQVDNKVKNNCTAAPAHIFVRAENPAGVYTYHVTEGWTEGKPGVFYGGILEPGQTSGHVFDGVVINEDAVERLRATGEDMVGFRLRGYARMLITDGRQGMRCGA
ncbi:MAG: hypothetical protein DUD30_04550 [Lactobacillus sp.]|nr:MAG: hypothetical protein DUD30_04550 [Lactobacillus sp.]